MLFASKEKEFQRLKENNHLPLKVAYSNSHFVDAWFEEKIDLQTRSSKIGPVEIKLTCNGLFGSLSINIPPYEDALDTITESAYLQIFKALESFPEMKIIRIWNKISNILEPSLQGISRYQLFNAGRFNAFKQYYGKEFGSIKVPAASAVGTKDNVLQIDFLAVETPIAYIENKDQIPAYRYSEKHGKIPPFFSRGIIYDNNGQRLLLSSGTASIVGEDSLHKNDIYEQSCQSLQNLRILGSQFNLKRYDIQYGFALEDVIMLRVYYKHEQDLPFLERFIPKFLPHSCCIAFQHADICRNELLIEVEAVFAKKGEFERGHQRPKYFLGTDGLIQTESFEIHVAEHCNLKCRDCCNLSPFNPKKFMSLEEVKDVCDFVKMHFRPDVFKVLGGEPTLHPQLDDLLKIVKQSKVSDVIRVITNGLLLHKMSDTFWENIDQLTISNYESAPVRTKIIDSVREKAKYYEVVLNIKSIDQFHEIFVDEAIEDRTRVQNIYDDCWMRHRCLIIRNGRFHKCTRASYMDSFLKLKGISPLIENSSYTLEDGIALIDPDFKAKALRYLNSTTPLRSCEYCLGVSGNLRQNIQLKTHLRS